MTDPEQLEEGSEWTLPPPEQGQTVLVNGNGERIYHMPSQQTYSVTCINPATGERWFCSEVEAEAAGWRKALQ